MSELASSALSAWQGFYYIIGSSGAALIGIQFVVITLIANMRLRPTSDSISAFATPTVMQLVSALLVSAIMSIPWPSLFPMSIALAMCGFGGLAYCAIVIRRARRQTYYRPEWEDWLWYAVLPSSIYTVLMITAIFLRTIGLVAMFLIGAAALGLLLVGIHNAWDSVTHIVVRSDGDATTPSAGN
ncbi:MAG: hypothetical protein ABFD97_10355 [Syntrophobacter sp.]